MSVVAQAPVGGSSSWASLARHRFARAVVGFTAVALFLITWQIIGAKEIVRSDLISYPSEIARALALMTASGDLGSNDARSPQAVVHGFLPANAIRVYAPTAFS